MVIRALRCSMVVLACAAGCVTAEGDVLTSAGNAPDATPGADAPGVADGGEGCAAQPPCPTPASGEITVCGQVVDLETSAPVIDAPPTIRIFELTDLQLDPTGAIPEAVVDPDACGYFSVTLDGVLGVLVVHTGELVASDPWRRTASLVIASPGQVARVNAFALRATTDDAWTQSAGLTGESFADRGATMMIYVDITAPAVEPFQGTPIAGVTMTRSGLEQPAADYYISGADPRSRSQIDPGLSATGPTGAALMIGGGFGIETYGGNHANCTLAQSTGLSLAGVVQVHELLGTCI